MMILIILCFTLILSLLNQPVHAQDFDMRVFADTLKYNWTSSNDRYEFRDDIFLRNSIIPIYENDIINIPQNMAKSLLLPGLGHFATKNYLRGQIFLSAEILLAGSAYFMYDKANSKYDQYKKATQIDKINEYYNDAMDSYRQATIVTSLFMAVWLYNIYDTYIVTKEYNLNLWDTYYLREKEKKLIVSPNGITYKF